MIPGQKLSGSQTLISAGGEFVLGFFSPGESNDRYIGIWYNQLQTDTKTVVWVANRDNPVVDPDGAFVLGEDGNLAVVEGSGNPIWYAIRDSGSASVVNAILLDSGNLVLKAGRDITWESFGDPTDTVVPGMKIRYYPPSYIPTSWKNQTDPGTGGFSFSIDPLEHKQVIILWNSKLYWESGIWDGNIFQKIQEVDKSFVFHFTMNGSGTDDVYVTYLTSHKYTRLVIDSSGELQFLIWFEPSKQWRKVWTTVKDKCIAACGPNTHCSNDNNSVVCSCLPGFQPVLPWHWDSGNWVDGCRRKELPCWKEDKFVPLTEVYVYNESSFENNLREDECQSLCHAICSCIAYAYSETRIGDSRCQIFKDKGMDFRVGAAKGGLDIYLRLSSSQPSANMIEFGQHVLRK